MTLILGAHMATKIFLVSDTRLTSEFPDGSKSYSDTINKSFYLNKRISGIAAGHVKLAASFITDLRKYVDSNYYMKDLLNLFPQICNESIRDFVNKTGLDTQSVAFIFAGYDSGNKKRISSAKLGDIMSAPLVARGGGSRTRQAFHPAVKQALAEATITRGGLGSKDYIEAKLPESRLFSLEIATRYLDGENFFRIKEVECYDYITFHPDRSFKMVILPPELQSQIEFPEKWSAISTAEHGFIYDDAVKLISFVKKIAKDNSFENVGGNIYTLMVTPEGSVFPTGDIATIKDDGTLEIMGIQSIDGTLYYKLPDGSMGPFKTIEGIAAENNLAELQYI